MSNYATARTSEFVVVYDLRDGAAWLQAHKHRRLWGRIYSDYFTLDANHVLLVFRSAGPQWEQWEQARERMILGDFDRHPGEAEAS